MKNILFVIAISIFSCSSDNLQNKVNNDIDNRFLSAFEYILKSEEAKKLWIQYESPLIDTLPILVNKKITNTDLLFFREEILRDSSCESNIREDELDSIYLAIEKKSEPSNFSYIYGPIDRLSTISKERFEKQDMLILIFSKPFSNLLEAELFHSSSIYNLDMAWVFGSSTKYLFCFSENNNINKVFTKEIANN